MQDASDGSVGGKNPYHDDRNGGKRNHESDQQRTQVRPSFRYKCRKPASTGNSLNAGTLSAGWYVPEPILRDLEFPTS